MDENFVPLSGDSESGYCIYSYRYKQAEETTKDTMKHEFFAA